MGWTSPTLPYLLSENSTIPLTPDQSSWVASLMILTSSASPLPAAYMADHLGRKPTLLLAAIPYIIGWLSIMEATSVLTLYIGRMIQGIGYGIIYTTAPMYLGEIASNHVRGSMATLITVMSKVVKFSNYSFYYVVLCVLQSMLCFRLVFWHSIASDRMFRSQHSSE